MLSLLLPIGALLAGIALMLLGTGLLNTLLALRGSLGGFSDQTLGLIGSAYFIGFFAGTLVAPGLIRRMGHIRAFAFFAAATAVCVLLHALHTHDLFWMLLRVITGIALVGFYAVIESWLNSQAPAEHRGQIFSVYMAVNLFALAGAQQFLNLASPVSFTLFAVAAIFVVLALMPVVATRLPPPPISDAPRMPLSRLWAAAPVAVAGALASGLAMGAFWGLGAVYAGRIGLVDSDVALFISITIVAGALGQWPMGRLSDTLDRRRALALIAGLAAAGGVLIALLGSFDKWVLAGCVVFGAAAFAVYPVVVAHLIDHLRHEEILPGNAALLLLHGLGAAIGPALAGALMGWTGAAALPLFFALMFAPAAAFAWLQSRRAADEIVEEAAHFMPMLRTSPAVLEMMTPGEEPANPTPAEAPQPAPGH
ncbi:MFS transporter [Thauera sp. CAU 1555]|uniref:MFS transporter n=1 Tax=Thauera sedimentorum TaxID=2767595 RepID=A0ABR9BBF2_9RHOO|nr:MFS transporter [Thauera sedimentorum]MBC9072750.1 MFS transporter [Thauera sedimentorum]MBD8503669.1 MFS transporter [Thauera sedimentorum]